MFIRDRRNTNWTKNIVIAAPVTMNSNLDNAGVLDPLFKFIVKNYDVSQYSTDNKKITSNYHPLPQLSSFLPCYSDFLFIRMFLNFHSFFFRVHLTLDIYVIFNSDLIFDSWNVFQEETIFVKNLAFMIADWKMSLTFRSCIHVLNVERKLLKEKFDHLWKKKIV